MCTKNSQCLVFCIVLIALLSSKTFAIPPLNPGPEPDYPAGVNVPSQQALMRDGADLEGEWNCLVILIDFEDYPWDNQNDTLFDNEGNPYTQEHFEAMLFSDLEFVHPGSESQYTGSMRDYFNEISREDFTVAGIVSEWYRAPRPFRYYCNADGEFGTDDDYGWGDYPRNAHGLAEQAMLAADDDVDFSDYDNNDDGIVDALFLVHAGPGAELFGRNAIGANYIWSHKGTLWERDLELDGVWLREYAMQPESGAISVFCHEFGHLLGLPDLYDLDYSTQGIGEWGLMGKGTWCHRTGDTPGTSPSHMCGWSKIQLGWVDVIDVTESMRNVAIPPIEESGTIFRVFPDGNEDSPEYFLLENRRRIGFDSGLTRRQTIHQLPAPEGLLITHIDERQRREDNQDNVDENHRLVDVEEASIIRIDDEPVEQLDIRYNNDWLNLYSGNRGDNGDLWPGFSEHNEDSTDWIGSRDRTSFGSSTIPSTILYDGEPSHIRVSDIRFHRDYDVACNIQIDSRGPYVWIKRWTINDESGNGNGFVEPGEIIFIGITLENIGEDPATGITAVLEYEGDLIEFIIDNIAYPDIEAGEIGESERQFLIRISEDAQVLRPVEMMMMVRSEQETWEIPLTIPLQKHPYNPVFAGDPNSWDSLGVQSPSVLIENDTLKCWYVGIRGLDRPNYSSIGFAWSLDGGITWRKREEPVLEADPDNRFMERGFADVAVIRVGEVYLMVLTTPGSIMNDYNEGKLYQAISEDGINWELRPERIIGINEGWFYMALSSSQLSLYRGEDDEIILAFAAVDFPFVENGIALASTNDLENWIVDDNPLIISTGNRNQFDGGAVYSPDITCVDGQYTLLYGGVNQLTPFYPIEANIGRLGIMTSENEQDFERYVGHKTGGAIIEPDEHVDWHERFIVGGRLFQWQDQYRIFYCAYESHEEHLYYSPAFGLVMGASIQAEQWVEPFPGYNPTLPSTVLLEPAYPNPFNSMTRITYRLLYPSHVSLNIYNSLGRQITTLFEGYRQAGIYSTIVNANGLPSGLYFVRLETPVHKFTRQITIVR